MADRSPSSSQPSKSKPFAAYHRARRVSAIGRAALVGIPVAALIAGGVRRELSGVSNGRSAGGGVSRRDWV
ncbi:MAG TPA: hypothetical protein VGI56_00325 [Galbitalea sp.]